MLLELETAASPRSELVAIDAAHINGPDGEGAGTVRIPMSKTGREGQGAEVFPSPATMRAIQAWRDAGQIDRGPLFRRIEAYLDGAPRTIGRGLLHPGSFTLIYKGLSAWRTRRACSGRWAKLAKRFSGWHGRSPPWPDRLSPRLCARWRGTAGLS